MNSLTDQQLLRDYTGCRSEAAFAELVRRHIDFVYSAALRMVRDAHLAEDVTQGVFVALAQHVRELTDHPVLTGWLHRTAQNLAAKAVRSDVRRRAREQEAAAMNELLSAEPDAVWEHIAPHLDTALGELAEADRDALLLRFFKNHDFRTIGLALGVSDDAAQKRVTRALDRLRAEFDRRGVTTTAVALSAAVSANAVQAAPVGLAVTISTAAALTGTTIATTATATAAKAIAMTTLQKTIIGAALAAAIGTGIYEARQASTSRTQVQSLQQQQVENADQIERLTRERDEGTQKELLRLRGEVGRLRQQLESGTNQISQQPAPPNATRTAAGHTPGSYISKDQLAYAGYATPEATVETMTWALLKGTFEQAIEVMSPKMLAKELQDPNVREDFEEGKIKMATGLRGMIIEAKKVLADDKVELKVRVDNDPAAMSKLNLNLPLVYVRPMVRVGNEWKIDGPDWPYHETWEQEGQIQSFIRK